MAFKIKICSFNMRCPSKGDGINFFPNRINRILEFIRNENPDIIGFQEAADMSREWLSETLTDYTVVGCGRDEDLHGESTVIAYRTKDFNMLFAETFWLSSAPSVAGSRYGADQSIYPRVATAAILRAKGAKKQFLFINTHLDHLGSAARMYGSIQLLQYIDRMNMPFVLTGDMNALPDAPEIKVITNCEYRKISDITCLLGGTFHNYGRKETNDKIDYIFSDMHASAEETYIVEDIPVEGVYISDHFPIIGFVTAE